MKDSAVLTTLLILGILITAGSGYLAYTSETKYQYDVKLEQVNADETDLHIQELERPVQEALHEAFRKQDGFASSSSVTFKVSEPIDDFTGWQEIQVEENTVLIASVEKEETTENISVIVIGKSTGLSMIIVGTVILIDMRRHPNDKIS